MSFPPDFLRLSHRMRRFNAPIGAARLETIHALLAARPARRIVDLGCGTGQWLFWVLEGTSAEGVGVDTDELALAEAAGRDPSFEQRIDWICRPAAAWAAENPASSDLAFCIGSSHAFGSTADALRAVKGVLAVGGRALFGLGAWHAAPSPEYEAFLGGPEERPSHAENIAVAVAAGFEVLWASTASLDEWDAFEWEFYRVAVEYARQNPDEASQALLEERRAWRDAYLRWGRGTMGFGYYLLEA